MDCEVFETEFFGESVETSSEPLTAEALNSTPTLVDIQKYMHRWVLVFTVYGFMYYS